MSYMIEVGKKETEQIHVSRKAMMRDFCTLMFVLPPNDLIQVKSLFSNFYCFTNVYKYYLK